MLKIIEKNSLYLGLYFVSFFIVFWEDFNKPVLQATFYFSNHRSAFGDAFFAFWTHLGEALPYLFVAIFFYFYKKDKQNTLKIGIASLAVLIIAGILKQVFDFPRPSNFMEDWHLLNAFHTVSGVDLNEGGTSFPSGHTTSAFAIWSLVAFQFKNKMPQIGLFLTAFLVGLSRVYLGQHFPQDVLFGSAIGVAIALCVEYYFSKKQVTTTPIV